MGERKDAFEFKIRSVVCSVFGQSAVVHLGKKSFYLTGRAERVKSSIF